jgi:dihydrofolate reductase
MRKLIVSEFLSLDGVMQAPGGADEDTEGGFKHGSWTIPFWHDDIGYAFGALMQDCDAFLLGRKTYVIHANAFEPMAAGDPFGDMMNGPAKYVVSKTLDKPIWRNTTIIRDNVVDAVRTLKASAGKTILTMAAISSCTPCSSTIWWTGCTCCSTRSSSAAGSACSPRACTGRSSSTRRRLIRAAS